MENVVSNYLKFIGIPISDRIIKKRIASHPDYPSILAISDTLTQFNIPHSIGKIQSKSLADVQYPILVHIQSGYGSLLQINQYEDARLLSEKLNQWSGVVIKAEPVKTIIDSENRQALLEEKRFRILVSILLLTSIALITSTSLMLFNWTMLILLTTSIAGAITGYFLYAKDIGITYESVEQFCSSGTGAGCGSVIRSKELFGFISLSDLTLSYFTFQLLVIGILIPFWPNDSILYLKGLLVLATLPVIGYTIWLQAVDIKKWCRLCIVVAGIMMIQVLIFGFLFYDDINSIEIDIAAFLVMCLLFGITIPSLLLLKQLILQKNMFLSNEIAVTRIKNSPDVFINILKKQKLADVTPFENEFRVGNIDAIINITIAVNLFCAPCKREIKEMSELISIYPDKVSLSIRLLKSRDDQQIGYRIIHSWLHCNNKHSNNGSKGLDMLNKWYESMNADQFSRLYPINENNPAPEVNSLLLDHYNWIAKTGITKTPSTFINGFELPSNYRVKDLLVLIPTLEDNFIHEHLVISDPKN